MNKKLLFFLLVLVLVSISWFKPAFCNEQISDSLVNAYLKYNAGRSGSLDNNAKYQSPQYYIDNNPKKVNSKVKSPETPGKSSKGSGNLPAEAKAPKLKPFGYDLFNSTSELSQPIDIAAASDYILGPGDNVIIYIWGRVEKEYNLTIDRQGNVFIPKIGATTAWGMTIGDFSGQVKQRLSRVYSDIEISVSLGKIRSIRIYLTGEVKKPGAYTVSSLTTLFNALYIAGGPNKRGSMRNIRLIRNNQLERIVDIYDFLLRGDAQGDIRLESGDAIFVPVTGSRVSISGEIKRPAIYELVGDESVEDLVELSGGATPEAYLDRIMINRISDDNKRVVLDANISPFRDEAIEEICLVAGDEVSVFSVFDMRRNIVKIAGMVQHPGTYECTDSTTVFGLINRGELRPQNVYFDRANIFRRHPDRRVEIIPVDLNEILSGRTDIQLRDLDSLHIYSIGDVEWENYVYIDGEVKNPGKFLLYDGMTVYDLIFLAGNLKRNAYKYHIELARTDISGKITTQILDITDPVKSRMALQEDDRIFVREIPEWFMHRLVKIEGEVRYPGSYSLLGGEETLYSLLKRAGGFTDRAFPPGLILRRKTISADLVRQNIPQIISNSEPILKDSLGYVHRMDFYTFNPDDMNRIIVDINKIITTDGREGDIRLQKDDVIYIPEIPSGISVMGAVSSNGTIKFEKGQKVRHYIKQAGNFTNQADESLTKLIKANGQVYSRNGTLNKTVEVGDVIFVPTEIKKHRDWLKSASAVATIVGGLLTSVLIIDKL